MLFRFCTSKPFRLHKTVALTILRHGWLLTLLLLSYNATAACTFEVTPVSRFHNRVAQQNTVNVSSDIGCQWNASSHASWITIVFGSFGVGDGTVTYSVTENTSPDIRTGTMTVARQTVTITQEAIGCSYTIDPTKRSHSSTGETGEVTVRADPIGCSWMARSNVSWANITAGGNSQGHGSVSYEVMSNSSTQSRSGTLTIAGQTFTVNQDARSLNLPPNAQFVITPTIIGPSPLTVQLDANGSIDQDGRIIEHAWNTSNGQTASGETASLTFTTDGTHTITLTVTDDEGATNSLTKTVTVSESTTRLINLSTRAPIEGGVGDVIAGFIISGTGTLKVLLRGFSLEAGVDSYLLLQKYPDGDSVGSNNDWQLDPQANDLMDLPAHLQLTNSSDAGLLRELPAGAYTVTLSSVDTFGLGLVGVDDVEASSTAKLINLSTRASIRGGVYDLIAGLIITGTGTQQVMIRGFGLDAGVDPFLLVQTYPDAADVASNDNWQTGPNTSGIAALPTHLQLGKTTDAGLLLNLPAGAYTVILSSVGAKGLGLIGVDAVE